MPLIHDGLQQIGLTLGAYTSALRSLSLNTVAAIVAHLFSQRILVYTCCVRGNIIRFMPPLNVEEAVLQQLIPALEQSFFATLKK